MKSTKELEAEIERLKEAQDEMAECIQDNTHRIIGVESRLTNLEKQIERLEKTWLGFEDKVAGWWRVECLPRIHALEQTQTKETDERLDWIESCDKIRMLLARRRMKIRQLAEDTGVHYQTVRGWLAGLYLPRPERRERIAAIFFVALARSRWRRRSSASRACRYAFQPIA